MKFEFGLVLDRFADILHFLAVAKSQIGFSSIQQLRVSWVKPLYNGTYRVGNDWRLFSYGPASALVKVKKFMIKCVETPDVPLISLPPTL